MRPKGMDEGGRATDRRWPVSCGYSCLIFLRISVGIRVSIGAMRKLESDRQPTESFL